MQAAMDNTNANMSQISRTSANQWQDSNNNSSNNNHASTQSSTSNVSTTASVIPDTTNTPVVPADLSDYNEHDINALLDHSEGIPKSLVEIYDISNRNRQRNKHRKKGQGGAFITSGKGGVTTAGDGEGDGDGDVEIEESGDAEMEVESYLTTGQQEMTIKSGEVLESSKNKMSSKSRSRSDSQDGCLFGNNVQSLDEDTYDEDEDEDGSAMESFYFDAKPPTSLAAAATTTADSLESQLAGEEAVSLDQTVSRGWQ